MGEAPAFQQNQPQGFQQQPPWNPPPPSKPVSQNNLFYQQQQPQKFNGNPYAKPYGVPYSKPASENVHTQIFNPCCCKRGECNLRRNCIAIAIAVFLIIAGLCQIYRIAEPLPINQHRCGSKGDFDYDFYDLPDLRPRDPLCIKISSIIMVMMALSALIAIFSLMAGIFLFIAVFMTRADWAALGAATSTVLISFFIFSNVILFLVAATGYSNYIDWRTYLKSQNVDRSALSQRRLEVVIISPIIGLISLGLNVWFTICAFQFSKQIKAGLDKYPTDGPPAQVVPASTPKSSKPQTPLAAASPAIPPQYSAGSPT